MSTLVLLELQLQSDKIADMKSYLAQVLPDTRSYDGCQGVDIYSNVDALGNMVAVERWESRGHYDKYLQWRTETGVGDKIISMLAEPPSFRYFERVDV
ncbi:putative quinol monooxygenase [Chloroflexota bacterium]